MANYQGYEVKNKEVVTGSATYEGETKDGKKHGMGTLTWEDGDQYVGEFKFDEKTNGTFRWKGGDTYTGEWKNSLMHGKGTYTYKNGRMYEGEWVNGYKEGIGVFTWPNDDKYCGQFYRDNCEGVGVLYYADGSIYKGHWKNNKRDGYGILRLPNGEKSEGFWIQNKRNGIAIFTEANGDRYEEYYENGDPTKPRKPLKRKGPQMEALLRSSSRTQWVSDVEAVGCYLCSVPFTLFNRRHHCRHCGQVFCNICTSHKLPIPRFGFVEPVRVCYECHITIMSDVKVPEC